MAIIYVNGTALPDPSEMEWGLYDVSAADSGRTEDALMHKNQIAQKRKLKLTWQNITVERARFIIYTTNHEYMSVQAPDFLESDYEYSGTFYVGDRSAPVALWWSDKKIVSQVTLDLIER